MHAQNNNTEIDIDIQDANTCNGNGRRMSSQDAHDYDHF